MRTRMVLLTAMLLLWSGPTAAADGPLTLDSRILKERHPELYRQIYEEGREAGRREAEAALGKRCPAATMPAALPAPSGKTEATAVTAAVQATGTAAKPDLGAWWDRSSLKFSPLPKQWLFHIEGSLDYKHRTGNTQSDRYNGSVTLVVRKQRFTNTFSYMIDKDFSAELDRTGKRVNKADSDYRSLQDALRYDLTDRFYVEGGYMWEKDSDNYLAGRDTYYGGFGYALIDTKRHRLGVFTAAGYEKEMYPEMIKQAMNLDHLEVGAAYFREDYRWIINDRFTYKQTFRIIQNLKSTDVYNNDVNNLHVIGETKRYRWYLINELYFKLTNHVNWMIGYKVEFDSNPWPTVERLDTTLKSGLQFSY